MMGLKGKVDRLKFVSTLEDYDDKFKFKISTLDKPNGRNNVELEKSISVTEIYDDKGYQHRYKVKEFLEEALSSFEEFFTKKEK
mmetsp:Transcript_14162/g.24071  ORF Transcript_14162/g.24071 Transcript_14162/m.24071 type:complete len:84 (+) Transcript_14162:409-660(+)